MEERIVHCADVIYLQHALLGDLDCDVFCLLLITLSNFPYLIIWEEKGVVVSYFFPEL